MTLPKVQTSRPPDPPAPVSAEHIKRKYMDVPYAHLSSTQKLDLYLPNDGEGPFPVIAVIHGGVFKTGDKGDVLKTGECIESTIERYEKTWYQFPACASCPIWK